MDAYSLLIIFSNLDLVTLFRSCPLVCREWYETFFSERSLREESFSKTLVKITYLNNMARRIKLKYQFRELYANDESVYSQFDEIKIDLFNQQKNLRFFHQLLNYDPKKRRMKRKLKKFITVNAECDLISVHREAKESIRTFSISQPFVLDSQSLKNYNVGNIFCVYNHLLAFGNKYGNHIKIVSLLSGKTFGNQPIENGSLC